MDGRDFHGPEIWRIMLSGLTQITIPKAAVAAMLSVWEWLSPSDLIVNLIGALFMLVLFDFMTGVRVSMKRGKYLSSRLWNRIVDKGVAYLVLSVCALVFRRYVPGYPLVTGLIDGVIGLVAMGELISVLENLSHLGVPVAGQLSKFLKIRSAQMADDLFHQPAQEPKGETDGV